MTAMLCHGLQASRPVVECRRDTLLIDDSSVDKQTGQYSNPSSIIPIVLMRLHNMAPCVPVSW